MSDQWREIGGYFELYLPKNERYHIPSGERVNSGFHALRLLLTDLKPSKVWIPDYNCNIVGKAIDAAGITHQCYPVGTDLCIAEAPDLGEAEMMIANNYFGLKGSYVAEIAKSHPGKVIIDNCQAWGASTLQNVPSFFSARKFLGVPDGGVAWFGRQVGNHDLVRGKSHDRCSHLLKRVDGTATDGYADFKTASVRLHSEPVTAISKLSEKMLETIDFNDVAKSRRQNYKIIAAALDSINPLASHLEFEDDTVPMVYPLMTVKAEEIRTRLIEEKVFVAKYWPIFPERLPHDSQASLLADTILPLPIDQRYDSSDMERILSIIME